MFGDSIYHTNPATEDLPHLIALLTKEFQAYVDEARMKHGIKPDKNAKPPSANDFIKFAVAYLDKNRPVQFFPVDSNHGFQLSNHVRCTISPSSKVAGTMQDSGAVHVTTGESQPGMDGVKKSEELRII